MKLSEISIQRPVLATVFSLTILLFGILSWSLLPVREYPDIDSPVVSVTTVYRGASAQVVETEITDVLEEALSTIEDVKLITSSSQEQVSRVSIEFNLRRNIDVAANDVRDRVSRVRGSLPPEVEEPIVAKQDVNAQPFMWLALTAENYDLLELSDFAHNVLEEKIQRIEGVGSVFVGASRRYAMRIWIDPQRMASHGLTITDIERALRAGNAEIPSGRVEGEGREFAVRTRGDLATPDEFKAVIIAHSGGHAIRLQDVADVELGAEDDRSVARFRGIPAVGLGITKQQKASTVEVADRVLAALPELRQLLPAGLELHKAYDGSTFIRDSMNEVVLTLVIAFTLVFIVIFVFLGSVRATLIPAIAIPVSLIGAFAATYFLGFSLNIITLLAMVLAIGLVVDDAIVMVENIYRHIEMGKGRLRAAFDGAKEIGFAIIATTVALIAVFVPVAFLTGRIGRLFNEFGIMVAVSVMISSFVALTLTPMLCSRALKRRHMGGADDTGLMPDETGAAVVDDDEPVAEESHSGPLGHFRDAFDSGFSRFGNFYERTLRFVLRKRRWVMIGMLAMVALIAVMFRIIPSELVPTEDRGLIFNFVLAPEGSTLEYTDRYIRMAEGIYQDVPEVDAMFTAVGLGFGGPGRVTDGFMFVRLKHYNDRDRSQQDIVQAVFPRMLGIPGVLAIPINPPSLGGGWGRPVQFVLQSDSYDELQNAVGVMMGEAQKLGYLVNMDSDLKLNKPQLEIEIDRDRAGELGVSVSDIGSTLQTLLGGREVTNFKRGNRQYDVIVQVPPELRASPQSIEELYVRGDQGLLQLANVVHVEERVSPRELNHFNRERAATISANLVPGVTIGKAIADLRVAANRALPPGIRTDLAGQSREFSESSGGLYFLFAVALVFIFLVLSAQFESFIHPMTILLAVPLAVLGALISLFIFGMTLNIYSQIGLIMLIGLTAKTSILIVEYANQRRDRGQPLEEAVVQASRIRLRPILMTTLATISGVLPIALGLGAGAESRTPLGVAVVGGLVFSTFLTLYVVPVFYTVLARFQPARLKHPAGGTQPAHAGAQPDEPV